MIDPANIDPSRLSVVGSTSGVHDGALVLSDDGMTLVFNPRTPFAVGERVSVSLSPGTRTLSGTPLAALSFVFDVSHNTIDQPQARRLGMLPSDAPAAEPVPAAIAAAAAARSLTRKVVLTQ